MSIQSEINRITSNISSAYTAAAEKNATMPIRQSSENLATTILSIPTGVDLPELPNPATDSEVFAGKEFIDNSGDKKIGAFTIDAEITEQDSLLAQIRTALVGKTAAGGSEVPMQEKTVNITENGTHEIFPDAGYTLSKVGVSVNVPIPDGYIKPSGELEITENGTHDVTQYASVNVNVEASGADGDSDLPSGYRRANYITFNDAQIVDTEIIPTQDTKIRVLFTREVSTAMYLYGVASTDNTASVTAYLSSGGSWRFGNKSASYTITVNPDLVQTALVGKTGITRPNATSTYSSVNDFEAVGTLLIGGGRNANGTVGVASYVGKIFLFEMWDGDGQVLKLIPVTDGTTFRFWDAVGKKFHDSITDTALEGGNL